MVLNQRQHPYPHWEFQDPLSGDLLRLVPERGGLISGWCCQGREVLYLDERRLADPSLSIRGGIPVLFPICGGLPDDRLPLPQGVYTLPQHGFARDMAWQLEPLADGRGIALELKDTPASLAAFPFPFQLRMEARLNPSALDIGVTVHHRGSAGVMPFSFGLHPYFSISDLTTVRVEGLPDLCFDHHTMHSSPTADQLRRIPEGVDLLCTTAGPVRLIDPEAGMAIALCTTTPWDLAVLWSDPPRPMLCLEPWSGPRQALLSGDRRLELQPGESMELQTRIVMARL